MKGRCWMSWSWCTCRHIHISWSYIMVTSRPRRRSAATTTAVLAAERRDDDRTSRGGAPETTTARRARRRAVGAHGRPAAVPGPRQRAAHGGRSGDGSPRPQTDTTRPARCHWWWSRRDDAAREDHGACPGRSRRDAVAPRRARARTRARARSEVGWWWRPRASDDVCGVAAAAARTELVRTWWLLCESFHHVGEMPSRQVPKIIVP